MEGRNCSRKLKPWEFCPSLMVAQFLLPTSYVHVYVYECAYVVSRNCHLAEKKNRPPPKKIDKMELLIKFAIINLFSFQSYEHVRISMRTIAVRQDEWKAQKKVQWLPRLYHRSIFWHCWSTAVLSVCLRIPIYLWQEGMSIRANYAQNFLFIGRPRRR